MAKSLPADFVKILREQYGEGEAEALLDALMSHEPTTSIRLNPLHWYGGMTARVAPTGPEVLTLPWCPLGRLLSTRPRFTLDPLLHSGAYYVQEAASMFLWHAMAVAFSELALTPTRALDLCASPGGKSTLARSFLPDDCLLVANEVVSSRTAALVENLSKWGHENVIITSSTADAFASLGAVFDVIIADVPCSGEGIFRKSEAAVSQWNMDKVTRCQSLQREIVDHAWQALHPGGVLIYSTCTFNHFEDEDNVAWICGGLGGETINLKPLPEWQILPAQHTSYHSYHFLPHRTVGEGFFLSAIVKPSTSSPEQRAHANEKPMRPHPPTPSPKERGRESEWVLPEADIYGQSLFPRQHWPFVSLLQKHRIHLLQVGAPIAEPKGRDKWLPLTALAHSRWLNKEAFPQAELSLDEALHYLRGQSLTLPPHSPRGFTLLTYQNHPLGFANNIGARANNLYPSAWRIRT